jgi:hypothetical protein
MLAHEMSAIVAEGFLRKKIVYLSPNRHTIIHSARKSPQFFLAMTNR